MTLSLDGLHQHVLNREQSNAFETYVDCSNAAGRMIVIDPSDTQWEESIESRIHL